MVLPERKPGPQVLVVILELLLKPSFSSSVSFPHFQSPFLLCLSFLLCLMFDSRVASCIVCLRFVLLFLLSSIYSTAIKSSPIRVNTQCATSATPSILCVRVIGNLYVKRNAGGSLRQSYERASFWYTNKTFTLLPSVWMSALLE